MAGESRYSREPDDEEEFTRSFDRFYTRFAAVYDAAVKLAPFWKRWLRAAIPQLLGPRLLEVSFGTGYLLTQCAGRFETHGVDYNGRMVKVAARNVARAGLGAALTRASVDALPYGDERFDTVLSTMAFSGYPNGARAMSEMCRVLKPDGRLVLVDVNYPADGGWLGSRLTGLWKATGDVIRDMGSLFEEFGLSYTDEEIGGFGSVHLYVAAKTRSAPPPPHASGR